MARIIIGIIAMLLVSTSILVAESTQPAKPKSASHAVTKKQDANAALQQQVMELRLQNRKLRSAALRAAAYLRANEGDPRVIAALDDAVRFRADVSDIKVAEKQLGTPKAHDGKGGAEVVQKSVPKPEVKPTNHAGELIFYGKPKFVELENGYEAVGEYINQGESRILMTLTITTYHPDGSKLETASAKVSAIEQFKVGTYRIPLKKLPPEGHLKIVAERDRSFD